MQDCLPASTRGSGEIFISTQDLEQSEVESNVAFFLMALNTLSPSETCKRAVEPLLCLFFFPLCDANGMPRLPSLEECATVRDEMCMQEWQTAATVLGAEQLPQCDSLPEATISIDCRGKFLSTYETKLYMVSIFCALVLCINYVTQFIIELGIL